MSQQTHFGADVRFLACKGCGAELPASTVALGADAIHVLAGHSAGSTRCTAFGIGDSGLTIQDIGCGSPPSEPERGDGACSDGADNDNDGWVDGLPSHAPRGPGGTS